MRRLVIALVSPHGDAQEGYFPDTLLELCTTEARRAGHHAALVRVYYDRAEPQAAPEMLSAWLAQKRPDLVVVERLFDPAPVVDHVQSRSGSRAVLISFGDAEPIPGVDLALGLVAGTTRSGRTRSTPAAGDLCAAFRALLHALATDGDVLAVPGVSRGDQHGPPLVPAPLPDPFEPALDAETLSTRTAPPVTRHMVFGNPGCPFALDTAENPHYRGLALAAEPGIARLGCAFCHAGGDYRPRPDEDVVADLVGQARYFVERTGVRELVIADQHPVRYLELLVRAAARAGLGGVRWLFPARADTLPREAASLVAALCAAEDAGQVLELYLTGFEAFSDEELIRYNKGVTKHELLEAVRCMRSLSAAHPRAFAYAASKGHSLVLWNPWTSVENLLESLNTVRAHGLCELFDDIGHNRLRLYPELPIMHAARRDGALVAEWESGDGGTAAGKGYAREQPWRFLDARTRLAWDLSRALRQRLGPETELVQLTAAAELAQHNAYDPSLVEAVLRALDELDARLRHLAGPERPRSTRDSCHETRAEPVLFGGPCNNGCSHCPNRQTFRDDAGAFDRVAIARATGMPIVLAGREPTLFPALDRIALRARGDDERALGLVTNGRRLSHAPFAALLSRCGVQLASVKVFGPDAATADAIARDAGSFEQTRSGVEQAILAGMNVELRIRLDARIVERLQDFAALAVSWGVARLRIEPALDALGLARLGAATEALAELEAACRVLDLGLVAAPLSAGAARFDRLPVRPR